jgi:NifU-like protein involved in Fe-S cluster formation
MGAMENPDGYGRITGSCGDTIQIFLKFENEKVKKALFQTDGCGSSAVCGSFAAELALGKTPDEIVDITGESILKKLRMENPHKTSESSFVGLNEIKKQRLIDALQQSGGNQSEAARILGISGTSVWNQMKRFNINFKKVHKSWFVA